MSLGCGIICVFCVSVCIKYSWLWLWLARLSLFADGGNDTKVIRLSWTRPGKLHSSKHRILGLITLSALSLFSEYRISPNKWQIVPDYWDWDGTIEHRSGVISPEYLWSQAHYSLDATGDEGWHGWAEPGERWEMRVIGDRQRPGLRWGHGHDKWMEHRGRVMWHKGRGQQYSHCHKHQTCMRVWYLFCIVLRLLHDWVAISSL